MTQDPRTTIAQSAMTPFQITAVAITIGLNALDGFDVQAIAFAAPGITKEWGIDRAALGFVLSMELIGMALGSVLLGGVTDRIGRRPMILGCLVVMTIGMFMVTTTNSIATLSAWRVFTGLGIGGMLAACNATVAEYANAKNRNLCVALMAIGYPVGAIIGGLFARELLKSYDWRAIFIFGAAVTALFIPLVWLRLPETIAHLCQRQGPGALEKVNATMKRMGYAMVDKLPAPWATAEKPSVFDIFKPMLLATTLIVTFAYFLHITTYYFILKWASQIVVDMGYQPAAAAGVLVWANIGGATGGALLGLAARKYSVRWLTVGVMLASSVLVSLFGAGHTDITTLTIIAAIAGMATNSGVVGLYAVFAQAFPTHVRATGTGFAIGMGRGGAAASPIIAGLLFSAGLSLQFVAMTMAAGSLIAALALVFLKPVAEEK